MIAFISDIHGNYPALKAVFDELDKLNCKIIFSLGDVVGYYSMINECIHLLKERKVINVLGNHDDYLINGFPDFLTSKTVKSCITYQKKIITKENLEWLKESSLFYDSSAFSLRHAGWREIREERFTTFDFNSVLDYTQKFYFSGHSHWPSIQCAGSKVYCNPGSIGQPRDGNPAAAFAILDDSSVKLLRVPYDIEQIVKDMKEKEQGDWVYRGLYDGKGI